jgi:hypothetical protein
MWQTEKGTPNELNRVMRQDKTGRSLETIEADDNDYAQGLARLEQNIKNARHEIKEKKLEFAETEKDRAEELKHLNNSIPVVKRALNKYKNPVLIKPAIKKDETYKFDDDKTYEEIKDKDTKQKDVAMEYLAKKIRKRYKNIIPEIQKTKAIYKPVLNDLQSTNIKDIKETRSGVKSVINDVLNNVDEHIEEKEENKKRANKIISLMAKGTSKRRLQNKKREYVQKVKLALKPTESPPPRSPVSAALIKKKIDDLRSKSAPSTPISTFRKQPEKDEGKDEEEEEEDDENDDDTVYNDEFNVSDTLKSSFSEGHRILDGFNGKADKYSVFKKDKALCITLNKIIDKIHNKSEGTSNFRTLRTLKRELHYGKTLTYVHAPKKYNIKPYNE